MREPDDIRLTRIEEGMIRLHEKLDNYNDNVMNIVKPMQAEQFKQHDKITVLIRDRWWIFTFFGFASTVAVYAVFRPL